MQITHFASHVKRELRTSHRVDARIMFHYFYCMSGVRILGRSGQRHVLSPCRMTPHPAYMEQQNTHRRRRMEALGAQIALLRQKQNMSRQEHLADASGVGVRTISDVETGKKVPRVTTMRKIETALGLPAGATDDFLDGKLDELRASGRQPSGPDLRDNVERKLWAITELSEPLRWNYIYQHRADLEQQAMG